MKFDVMTSGLPLRSMATFARDAERAGFSGIVVTEGGRTAYLGCGAAALAADIDILTGVAVAFPRSPMVTAETAWELAEATSGRFRLGLGKKVRDHRPRVHRPHRRRRGPLAQLCAMQVAFYGSTPNYSFIFEQLGFEGTTARIRERQRARDLAGMAAEVSDELLDHFVVTGLRNELADRILERYELATRVVSYFGDLDWTHDP